MICIEEVQKEEGTHWSESMPGHQASVSSSVKWANTPSFQGQCEELRRELEQQREVWVQEPDCHVATTWPGQVTDLFHASVSPCVQWHLLHRVVGGSSELAKSGQSLAE